MMIIGCNDYHDHLRFSGIIVILILQKINRENWSLHSEELFEIILLNYMIMTNLPWPLDYMTLTSPALLCIYLTSLVLFWICHLILLLSTLSRDLGTHCFHYLTLIFLTPFLDHLHWVTHYFVFVLINKINQAGVIGGDG